MARYIMTARRKAALRKAQLASARKRRKGRKTSLYSKKRRIAAAAAGASFYMANEMVGLKTGKKIKPYLAAGIGIGIGQKVLRGGQKKKGKK